MATATAIDPRDVAELESVTWEMERRGLIAPDFGGWLDRSRPEYTWDYRHQRYMQRVLDRLTTGELLRVLFQIAGRHGKTETIASYAAYRIARDPKTRVLLVTYSQGQAHKLSRQIRRISREGGTLTLERDSAGEWETREGGGLRAVGVGTGTASINADLILIDDPIGNRAEAESQAHRDRVWDSLTTDILARCEPHTGVVFSMPRWHKDDPAGRFQDRQAGRWEVVDMPGRADITGGVFGQPEGAPLWPELRGEKWHEGMRIEVGEYGYASFILCRPRPREGGMFQWDWWKLLDTVPAMGSMVRYWDLAGTDAKGSNDPDYSAGSLLARMQDQRTAIVDVERFRLSVAKRDAKILEVCRSDLQRFRGRVSWWIETEAGISGADRTASLVRSIQALGMACRTEHPTGSKELRAEPLASATEAGNVVLCPGEWRDAFRLEASDFPHGSHDDQIDAAAGAFAKVGAVVGAYGSSRFKV